MLISEKQQAAASIEADKASIASAEAAAIEKDAEKELAQAEPAMLAAAEAVNCLSKSMLTELKSLPKPPAGVDKVHAVKLLQALSWSMHRRSFRCYHSFCARGHPSIAFCLSRRSNLFFAQTAR